MNEQRVKWPLIQNDQGVLVPEKYSRTQYLHEYYHIRHL